MNNNFWLRGGNRYFGEPMLRNLVTDPIDARVSLKSPIIPVRRAVERPLPLGPALGRDARFVFDFRSRPLGCRRGPEFSLRLHAQEKPEFPRFATL